MVNSGEEGGKEGGGGEAGGSGAGGVGAAQGVGRRVSSTLFLFPCSMPRGAASLAAGSPLISAPLLPRAATPRRR